MNQKRAVIDRAYRREPLDVTQNGAGLWMAALQEEGVDTDALLAYVDPETGPRWHP
jgi:hypothetical protein